PCLVLVAHVVARDHDPGHGPVPVHERADDAVVQDLVDLRDVAFDDPHEIGDRLDGGLRVGEHHRVVLDVHHPGGRRARRLPCDVVQSAARWQAARYSAAHDQELVDALQRQVAYDPG